MANNSEALAVSYAHKTFGDNYAEVLQIAHNIEDGNPPATFNPKYLDSFGGAAEIRSVVESKVTARVWREAQDRKANVVQLWAEAAGESTLGLDGGNSIKDLFGSNQTQEQRLNAFKSAFENLNTAGEGNSADMKRIRELDEEIKNTDSDYTKERLTAEKDKLTAKVNNSAMDAQMGKAREGDARELTAIIVLCGRDSVPTFEIYDAIINP